MSMALPPQPRRISKPQKQVLAQLEYCCQTAYKKRLANCSQKPNLHPVRPVAALANEHWAKHWLWVNGQTAYCWLVTPVATAKQPFCSKNSWANITAS